MRVEDIAEHGRVAVRLAAVEGNSVLFLVVHETVFRQVLMLGNMPDRAAKLPQVAPAAGFFVQEGKANGPFALLAAMLAGQLVQAALDGLSQPEIIPVNGQHLKGLHGIVQPFRQGDFDSNHTIVNRAALDDLPTVDDPKTAPDTYPASGDVSFYSGAFQPFKGCYKALI